MGQSSRQINLGFAAETIPEGRHIAYIYSDDRERKRTMARFIQQGLLDREKTLYLVDDISPDEMKQELQALGVDVDSEQGGFKIAEGHHAQCPGQCFSPDFMLGTVGEFYDSAVKEGFVGARGAGEMSWALRDGRTSMTELLDYEARLNDVLAGHPLTTICQYDARRFSGTVIMDLLSVHPMMIVRGQMVRNPSYVEPETFLSELHSRH